MVQCVGTSGGKAHQAIPQSQMGQATSLETEKENGEQTGVKAAHFITAVRTTAFSLGTCCSSLRPAQVHPEEL